MDTERLFRITRIPSNIKTPDVWIDTDCLDAEEQFALAWALLASDQMNIVGITADGGRDKLETLLALTGRTELSRRILPGREILEEARRHGRRNPLYILALGPATHVAAAIQADPAVMAINAVTFWLGGHSFDHPHTHEKNMFADPDAARALYDNEIYLCQIPCAGVLESLSTTEPELRAWIKGQNPLGDYLYALAAEGMPADTPWSRILWDMGAVAALLSRESRKYTMTQLESVPLIREDSLYARDPGRHGMRYVYAVKRDAVLGDLFGRIRAMSKEKAEV